MKRLFNFLKEPPLLFIILAYILSALFIIAALLMLVFDYTGTALEYLAYLFFALAALGLSYSVYLGIRYTARLKTALILMLKRNRYIARFLEHYGFRTFVLALFGLLLNVAYSVFYAVGAVIGRSIWYGALAAYYLLLTAMRSVAVLYKGEAEGIDIVKYRATGIFLTVMPLSLSPAIAQMVAEEGGYFWGGYMIYAVAAYTFWKLTISIINVIRARKNDDITVRAVRDIGLADSLVSILSLQSALLNSFGDGSGVAYANAATGTAVCALTLALGIYIIINSVKMKKEMKKEEIT